MSKELIELSNALAQATDRAASSVVAVHTERRGSSSGIVWRSGVIVTSEHALRRDEEIQVTLPNGRVVSASLAGRDPSTDIAVLKCAEASNAAPEFGDAAALKPGSLTLVVGRTRVSGPVAALGVVSLVAPDRRTWTGASIVPYIRLDVGLQPTAVGGAVIDAHGRTVGLATPRFARFGAIAVPASSINKITDILLQKGRIPRGYLGVGLQPVRLPDALRDKLKWNRHRRHSNLNGWPAGHWPGGRSVPPCRGSDRENAPAEIRSWRRDSGRQHCCGGTTARRRMRWP